MKVQKIYHSCFVVDDERALLVFDYWLDPDGLLHSILEENAALGEKRKPVYFFVSHFHADHCNREILTLGGRCIVSYDVPKRQRMPLEELTAVMRPGDTFADGIVEVKAFKSTDIGVCYLLRLSNGELLFHAGDFNNWYFPDGEDRVKISADQMEKLFLSILRTIKAEAPKIDHVMFPVDPRLGDHSMRGPDQFRAAIQTTHFYPMHCWERGFPFEN